MTHAEAVARAVKLLRLAQSDNAHEAASAAAKAQEIIDRHKLGTLGIDEPTAAPEPEEPIADFGAAPLEQGRRGLATWKIRLASTIARANQCRIYLLGGRAIAIVGRASDAETVRYFYDWLISETDRLADRHGRGLGKTWRNNFRLGVVEAVGESFAAQAKATVAALKVESPGAIVRIDTALARVEARGAAAQSWMDSHLKLGSYRRSEGRFSPSAREAGRAAGREIRLGGARGALGSGRKALGGG